MLTFSSAIAFLLAWNAQVQSHGALAEACGIEAEKIERRIQNFRLSERYFEGFRRVAERRRRAGLDILPGIFGCMSVKEAAREVRQDLSSTASLRRYKLDAETYVVTGWALAFYADSHTKRSFLRPPGSRFSEENKKFVAEHRRELRGLLYN